MYRSERHGCHLAPKPLLVLLGVCVHEKGLFHHQQGLVPNTNGAAKQGSNPVHAG
jgi:hypothetical protein